MLRDVGLNWDARIHVGKAGKPETQTRYEDTVTRFHDGYLVTDVCDASNFRWDNVDYNFYLNEVEKLVIREG